MTDFQTNQQKRNLPRAEFIKLCGNIDGTVTIAQAKNIIKTIGFDASSTKVDKFIRDYDIECKEVPIKSLVYVQLMSLQ
ncbi:unnamed protein product [Rotaria magnacalcarata]|uniref:Uncharacterized protein n=1 Tax=Rotaria magnacalcarata TaxID=392030 RepID=A0A816Y7V7_9BILA|nr:unnamed protein product [Rotaria magnacalcarata]CAF3859728.1 unnamed protein product [Rotaria magnacalcarata]